MALPSDHEILKQWQAHRSTSERGLSKQYSNTRTCQAFYAGDQMRYEGHLGGKKGGQLVVFNKVKPYINAVRGFLSQTAPRAKYYAVLADNEAVEAYSRVINDVAEYVRFNAYAESHESMQNADMLICGYGCVDTNMSYGDGYATRDPNGEVIMERVHPLDVGWDPNARHTNLMDARWVYRRKQYELKEALEMFDDTDKDDFESADGVDPMKVYFPGGGNYDKIAYDYAAGVEEDLVDVFYYQWWQTEIYYRAENPLYTIDPALAQQILQILNVMKENSFDEADEGDVEDLFEFNPEAPMLIMTGKIRTAVKDLFESFGIPFKATRQKRKMFYTAVISADKVLQKFKSPDQSGFTLKFKTADYDDSKHMWFGMVNSLKEPSIYFNKSLTELMYIIASNSKGGVMLEEDAVDDIADFEKRYAKTNGAVVTRPGALSGGKIQEKARPQMNTGYEMINQMADKAISDVIGLDRSFFGEVANGNESGVMFAQRISQAFTILQTYVDAIKQYHIEHGRMMLSFIRMFAENSPGRLIRITSPQGGEVFQAVSPDNFVDEYDVGIEDAPRSAVEKEAVRARKLALAQQVAAYGVNIYDLVLDDLGFDPQTEAVLRERLGPKQNQPDPMQIQMQMQMAQLDLQRRYLENLEKQANINETQSDRRLTDARTVTEQAKVAKTQSEVIKDRAEAAQKELENQLMRVQPINNMRLVI